MIFRKVGFCRIFFRKGGICAWATIYLPLNLKERGELGEVRKIQQKNRSKFLSQQEETHFFYPNIELSLSGEVLQISSKGLEKETENFVKKTNNFEEAEEIIRDYIRENLPRL